MSKQRWVRKHVFVDFRVQGALAVRVAFYWLMCLLSITLLLLCWRVLTGPPRLFYTHAGDMWFLYGPAAVASLLVLPMIVYDVIRLSHRFAGPMFRLRRAMRELADGEKVEPVHLRDGDFWQDFAADFNRVVARLETQEHRGRENEGLSDREESLAAVGHD